MAVIKQKVVVRFPPSNVAVPGPYHLFLIDGQGIPSVAAMVMIERGPVYVEAVSGGVGIPFFMFFTSFVWWLL
jgi:hypothetical protein